MYPQIMAMPGEMEYYAAGSGLPATATLGEHKAAYFRAQLAGDAPTDTLNELEYQFYLEATGLTRQLATLSDARAAYFAAEAGHAGYVSDLMVEVFAGGGGPGPSGGYGLAPYGLAPYGL